MGGSKERFADGVRKALEVTATFMWWGPRRQRQHLVRPRLVASGEDRLAQAVAAPHPPAQRGGPGCGHRQGEVRAPAPCVQIQLTTGPPRPRQRGRRALTNSIRWRVGGPERSAAVLTRERPSWRRCSPPSTGPSRRQLPRESRRPREATEDRPTQIWSLPPRLSVPETLVRRVPRRKPTAAICVWQIAMLRVMYSGLV